jgi:hypothetical protein
MNIQWRYWWDTSQYMTFQGGHCTQQMLHVAGLRGVKTYGISVKADIRFEKQYLEAAKQIIANKLH